MQLVCMQPHVTCKRKYTCKDPLNWCCFVRMHLRMLFACCSFTVLIKIILPLKCVLHAIGSSSSTSTRTRHRAHDNRSVHYCIFCFIKETILGVILLGCPERCWSCSARLVSQQLPTFWQWRARFFSLLSLKSWRFEVYSSLPLTRTRSVPSGRYKRWFFMARSRLRQLSFDTIDDFALQSRITRRPHNRHFTPWCVCIVC